MYHLISQLASQITADFGTGTSSPVFIGVANGTFIFIADLLRKINLPVSVDFIRDDSYDSGTLLNGVPKISLDLKLDIQGKHVILSSADFQKQQKPKQIKQSLFLYMFTTHFTGPDTIAITVAGGLYGAATSMLHFGAVAVVDNRVTEP